MTQEHATTVRPDSPIREAAEQPGAPESAPPRNDASPPAQAVAALSGDAHPEPPAGDGPSTRRDGEEGSTDPRETGDDPRGDDGDENAGGEESEGKKDSSAAMIEEFRLVVEALVFAADEPVPFRQIRDIIAGPQSDRDEETTDDGESPRSRRKRRNRFTVNLCNAIIDSLNEEYAREGRAFRIVEIAGGFTFQTTTEFSPWVARLYGDRMRRRMTQSALETLAIIAFRQPISKPAIESIRGVNSDFVIKSLLERDLITIVGRDTTVGRPLLYGTTKTFLRHFGLRSLEDLPKPREIEELIGEEHAVGSPSIEENGGTGTLLDSTPEFTDRGNRESGLREEGQDGSTTGHGPFEDTSGSDPGDESDGDVNDPGEAHCTSTAGPTDGESSASSESEADDDDERPDGEGSTEAGRDEDD